jgi:hypothetical protein
MRLGVFLTGTGALVAGAPPGRLACAQPAPNRSAIVIGVDKVGDLPKLNVASSGAPPVAQWLRRAPFAATLFADDDKPWPSAI